MSTHEPEAEKSLRHDLTSLALALLEQRHSYQRSRVRWMLAWLPVGGFSMLFLTGFFGILAFPVLVAELGLIGQMVNRPARTRRTIVWLRRFHTANAKNFPFDRILADVCLGIATPVTLRDSRVRYSLSRVMSRPGAAFIGWAKGFVLLIVQFVIAIQMLNPIVKLVLSSLSFVGYHWWLRASGVLRLSASSGVPKADSLINRIHSKRGGRIPFLVLGVPNCIWQPVVDRWIKAADAVIVEVSHISENLIWEMQTCRSHLRPEQVIFIYESKKGEDSELPSAARDAIQEIWGTEVLHSLSIFRYSRVGLIKRLLGQFVTTRLSERYRGALIQLFARAFYAADSV